MVLSTPGSILNIKNGELRVSLRAISRYLQSEKNKYREQVGQAGVVSRCFTEAVRRGDEWFIVIVTANSFL